MNKSSTGGWGRALPARECGESVSDGSRVGTDMPGRDEWAEDEWAEGRRERLGWWDQRALNAKATGFLLS